MSFSITCPYCFGVMKDPDKFLPELLIFFILAFKKEVPVLQSFENLVLIVLVIVCYKILRRKHRADSRC